MKRNEMMDRPVINNDVREYLRTAQKPLPGKLGEIQREANEKRVPVIPHETVVFLDWLFPHLQPKRVLEVGTAVGFSASLMAQRMPEEGHLTTIERNPVMIEKAKKTFTELGLEDKIALKEGQAQDVLQELDGPFDFIFMDSAKAKYYDFFPYCMKLLKTNGVLAVDDILQGGTILQPDEEIPRRRRKIHRKLNEFLDVVLTHPSLQSSILPLGDGLLLITKKEDADFSFMEPKIEE
ncbi:O-methyltransferase [Atopococcus tabaci]|uniref:O-methyltransferase n=1 Tax=Atopococcus tabaci TaxID=269774 RepID=UPI00240A2810|nr:O-methyltransferase [Atopococcus tabaci]